MKHVNFISICLSLLMLLVLVPKVDAATGAKAKTVLFITDDEKDDPQIEFLERQGLIIDKFWPGALSEVSQDTIDILNAADLIIIGRSPGSGTFQDPDKQFWNALTVPIISNNQYGSRSSRINWFNSTSAFHDNEGPNPVHGFVEDTSDPIFEFATLTAEDSVDMYIPPHDFLSVSDFSDSNADLIMTRDTIVLIARFDANVEFYTGAGDMPAGPRTYFGFGNDNTYLDEAETEKFNNYFPLTNNARHIYKAEIFRMLGLDIEAAVLSPADRNVIFITDDEKDDPQIAFLERNGFKIHKFWPGALSEVSADTISHLNRADLIIIGRSPGSGTFQDPDKQFWNALTAPIISNNQYGSRSSRINWFNSTSAFHDNEGPNPVNGYVEDNTDPIFEFATLTAEDSVDMYIPPHDFLSVSDFSDSNADLIMTRDTIVLIARFEAGVEFYTGAGDMPAGPRTYFGFGNDNTYLDEAETEKFNNYFPLTDNARNIYLAELLRMLDLPVVPAEIGGRDRNVIFITDDDNDDKQIAFLARNGFKVEKFWPGALSEVGVDTINHLNRADLIIIGRSPGSGTFQDPDKQFWNALTAPIISNNQYGSRSSRINWFNSTSAFHDNEGPNPVYGFVEDNTDPIFEHADVTAEDSVAMYKPPHDFLSVSDLSDSNADVIMSRDTIVLIARFEAGVEFYTGAGDMPAGPRTYFGFGNDNTYIDEAETEKFINYFPLTDDAKHVYLAEIQRMVGLPITAAKLAAEDREIIFITDDEKDDPQVDFLTTQGFDVKKLWPGALSTVQQDTIDLLNNADLIIIGRSPSSGTFEDPDKQVWNALTTPIISNNQYGSRSNRINWFNSTSAFHANEGPDPFNAFVELPEDPIFEYVRLTAEDSVDMYIPPHDFLSISAGTQTNAEIVASHDTIVVIARFDAGVEFYTGSGDMPAGPRTYFGFGNDDTGEPLYFPLTDNARRIYVAEILRMLSLPISDLRVAEESSNNTILFVHDADNIDESNGGVDPRDQPFIDVLVSKGYNVVEAYEEDLSFLSDEELAPYNDAGLVIVGRSGSSGDFRDANKKAWNRVKAPLMLMSPFAARNSRLNWFPSSDTPGGGLGADAIALDSVTVAAVLESGDPAFDGVDIGDGNINWFTGPYRTLFMTADQYDSSAATHLVIIEASDDNAANATDDALIMARFETGIEFYTGAADSAAAPRSYFGLGNDDTTYYNISSKAEQIWLNEIDNLIGSEYEALEFASPNAGLADLTTGGSTVSGFNVALTSYTVELGSSDIPEVGATAIDADNAVVEIVQATELPGTATVTVTAADEVTTLVYEISFLAPSEEKKIIFVGDDTEATAGVPDGIIMDSLAAWGYRVTYFNDDDYNSAIGPNHAEFNGVFFSESMSSQASAAFVDAGYPLPVFSMEPFIVMSSSGRLDLGEAASPGTDPNFILTTQTKVINADHDITSGIYEINQVVDVLSEDTRQMYTTIRPEFDPIYLGDIEGGGVESGLHSWVAIEPSGVLNWRLALFSWLDGSAEVATDDYWVMMKRTFQWAMYDLGPEGGFTNTEFTSDQVNIYPNPTKGEITLDLVLPRNGEVEVSILNINGQVIKMLSPQFRAEGRNSIKLDLNSLQHGLYFIKVKSEGVSGVYKFLVD